MVPGGVADEPGEGAVSVGDEYAAPTARIGLAVVAVTAVMLKKATPNLDRVILPIAHCFCTLQTFISPLLPLCLPWCRRYPVTLAFPLYNERASTFPRVGMRLDGR